MRKRCHSICNDIKVYLGRKSAKKLRYDALCNSRDNFLSIHLLGVKCRELKECISRRNGFFRQKKVREWRKRRNSPGIVQKLSWRRRFEQEVQL